jgi:hypothetical protein
MTDVLFGTFIGMTRQTDKPYFDPAYPTSSRAAAAAGTHALIAGDGLFFDGFETGDFTSTNTDGFNWGPGTQQTSIVTATADTAWCVDHGSLGIPTATANDAPGASTLCNGPQTPAGGGDWLAKTGDFCMRFLYHSSASWEWSEQRLAYGTPYLEIWQKWRVRVPTNFTHRHGAGIYDPKKFSANWMDVYSANPPDPNPLGRNGSGTVVTELYTNGSGGSDLHIQWNSDTTVTGGADAYGDPQQLAYPNFILESDAGKWMEVILHVKAASDPAIRDGIVQFYRRWDGETYFTEIFNDNTRCYPLGIVNGWSIGYLMGYDNGGYAADTEWFVDDYELSQTPLVQAV